MSTPQSQPQPQPDQPPTIARSSFDILDELESEPAKGRLVPLRTRAEVQASDETIDVFVCEIPLKQAGHILKAIKNIPGQDNINLHHLRRVVKDGYIPESLQHAIAQSKTEDEQGMAMKVNGSTVGREVSVTASGAEGGHVPEKATDPMIYIVVCPTCLISEANLSVLLSARLTPPQAAATTTLHTPIPSRPRIFAVPAPLHPPTSPSHSLAQSQQLWPTLYNPNTSYGPSPSTLLLAQQELEAGTAVGRYMALAAQAGQEARARSDGERVGVVVVEREGKRGRVVGIAGDARWADWAAAKDGKGRGKGNPAHHAIMRAVSLIAFKRRQLASTSATSSTATATYKPTHAAESPITPLEKRALELSPLAPNGYLCLNLEFYVTHEPCLMCCMALVHSRVGRVVFGSHAQSSHPPPASSPPLSLSPLQEPPEVGSRSKSRQDSRAKPSLSPTSRRNTGALKAEGKGGSVEGYGLFWREDLNWRFLCWEWLWQGDAGGGEEELDLEVGEDVCV